MKGKKVDAEFVSQFISDCIRQGLDSQVQIVEHAKDLVRSIEGEIKRIEEQKLVRSRLLDVITMLEKPVKADKTTDIQLLSFFKIEDPHICKYICDKVKGRFLKSEDFMIKQFKHEDVLFCLKQLIEHRILVRLPDQLITAGEMFDEYIKFVLRDKV